MSFLGKHIPYISITSEEKNEENTKGRNIIGTDTDSDSSSSDHEVNGHERVSNKNNTLNTNNKKEDGATDVENLEESDDEDFLNNDETAEQDYSYDLDLHERSFVSNSSKQIGSVNIQVTSNYSDQLEVEKENVSGGVTDTEELNGSNDEAPEPITEINLSQILTDHMNTINIIDDVKNRDLTSMETQCGGDVALKKGNKTKKAKKPTRKFQLLKKSNPYTNLIASPLSPQLSDITDTEIIYSDSDDDRDDKYKSSSSKKRRTRIISSKTKDILTDTEDIYLSDRDGRPKLKRELSLSKKPEFSGSHVLTVTNDNIDSETNSDTDDEIVSIVTLLPNKKPIKDTKKKISFPKMQLVVHNDESVGILTDVDDFEADDDVDEDVQDYDQQLESPNIPEQLLEMESFCTTVSEEMNTRNTPKFYITETFAVNKNQQRKPIFYTIEDLEEEEMEFDTSDSESHTNEAVINDLGNGIVFYTNGHKIPKLYTGIKNINLNSNLLSIQETNDGGVTDTENLNSSDDEDIQKKVIPVAILKTNKIDSDTDSEEMDTEVDVEKSNDQVEMPDLELPKPVCEQITIKYDTDGHPKVTIEPITDQTSFGLYDSTLDDGKTDTEDMLFDENILEEDYKETNINIPIFDDDEQNNTVIVTNSEFKKNENQKDSSSKSNRKLKKSNKYNKPTNELTVESTAAVLTDREDIDVSDAEDLQESGIDVIKKSTAIPRDVNSVREIKTDTEDMGVSDDDLNELIDIKRALSVTPDMMYLMAGNSTVSKEYDNNNMSFTEKSFIDFKDIPHIEMTSATPEIQPTDTEDVFTSADEEFTTTYSRAETATPIETKNPYDDITASQVHVQYTGKFDETEEILHIKGGCYYPDIYTDIEDLGMSDDELLYDGKQQDDPSKDKSKPNETHKTFITKYDSEEQSPARTASGPRELTDVTQQLPGEEIDIQDTAPTETGDETLSTTELTPKPKPRAIKHLDNQIEAISPMLDTTDSTITQPSETLPTENVLDSYSDRKKFWENIGKDQIDAKEKTKSFIESEETFIQPPIPKPRSSMLHTAHSFSGTTIQKSPQKGSVTTVDVPVEVDIIEQTIPGKVSQPLSEYMASFQHPGFVDDKSKVKEFITTEIQSSRDILESEEKTVKTKVSQIPISVTRKTMFERSVSLPTDNLQDMSETGFSARKKYFEQQIRNDIVVDQLMTQVEEEPSPEHKAISRSDISTIDDVTEKTSFSKSTSELPSDHSTLETEPKTEQKIIEKVLTVKDITQSFQSYSLRDGKDIEITESKDSTTVETEQSICPSTDLDDTIDISEQPTSITDHKLETITKPSDSLEVHVDKSEIEDSEKAIDIDQEISISYEDISKKDITAEKKDEELEPKQVHKAVDFSEWRVLSPINIPEEHVPDTVWEVPVQSQPISSIEEIVYDIPIESQIIFEKEEDSSEQISSEKTTDSHTIDMIKDLREDPEQYHISKEDALNVANELIGDIEREIQKRCVQKTSSSDSEQGPDQELTQTEISDYLRQLAESKGLDEREVQLVESVLSRKQRELSLMSRTDTQTTSSMEITDEDLRCSGAETDISPGEAKIEEKSIKLDLSDIEKTLAEVQESLHAAQEELLETGIHKKPSPSEFQFKGISQERKFSDRIDESTSEELHSEQDFATFDEGKGLSYKSDIDKKVSESKTGEVFGISKEDHIKEDGDEILKYSSVEKESLETKTKTDIKQTDIIDASDNLAAVKRFSGSIFEDTSNEALETQLATEILSEGSRTQELESETLISTEKSAGDTFESEMSVQEVSEGRLKSVSETESRWSEASNKEEINKKISQSEKILTTDDGTTTTTSEFFEEIRVEKLSSSTTINKLQEEQTTFTVTSSTISDDDVKSTLHKVYEESFSDYEKPDTEQESTKRDSSEESTKEESTKSPDEQLSSSSSGRRGDSDTTRVTDRHGVILRKTKPHRDLDTSSSSGGKLKTDRRSGVDAWSSSGESHYHSFEQDSGRSRPCSSDIEGMVFAGGSSEYDTAPDRSHLTTSAEFHTAVSSLSSRDSMKSLDSESSGHLASVEVSEASETLVPSAFELEGDILDEAATDVMDDEEAEFGYDLKEQYLADTISQITKKDRRELMSLKTEPSESIDISEEDFPIVDMKSSAFQDGESSSKMKRSYEMTFQPEPRVIIDDSPQSETGVEMDDKYGSSIEDGSILSMSYSSTSDASAVRSVIEVTKIDPSKYSSTTSLEEVSKMSQETQVHGSQRFSERDSVQSNIPLHISSDDFESTSVTLMTSQVTDENNQTVSTQITSTQHNGPTQVDYVPDYDDVAEPKKRGHRRYESTSSFVPSMITSKIHTTYIKDIHKFEEDDSKHIEMTTKEVSSSEKKDIDEAEKIDDISDIIPDHGMHKYYRDDITDTSCDTELEIGDVRQDFDSSRPHSQISKSDSESQRAVSTGLSDEIADSELTELLKQCSSEAVTEDPIERPLSPEPVEMFEKDDSPSARIRASDKDLELEFSISQSRSPDSFKSECIDQTTIKQETRKSIEQVKFGTSSEKSSFEEAEAAFSMVPHISPVHQAKPIGTIIEDEDAEKHEFETKEKSDKEKSKSIAIQDQSPGNIPDIMVTQHMTPLVDRGFRYPDMELEEKEEAFKSTPQTPASISSKSSEETDQGREYILDECEDIIHEEPETEVYIDEKLMTESKSEVSVTGDEKTVYETDAKQPTSQTESPASDSFELLENPDITEDFVVIEEVAKEADEFDSEGKSVAIKQTKYIRKHDEEMEQYLVKSAPAKMTNIKYYPGEDEMGPFDFEDSPPTADNRSVGVKTTKMSSSSQEYSYEFDRDLEANKKWMEMQFQGDQAAILASGYGYEMEFERVPLEDIKEEETTDFDPSSRIGSMGSQKESGGSFSSVKDSFSSTPEYDVLAGRKFFARSGEHDDVSMSSLQEFENLEQAISLENKRHHHGSQDSISNGSFTRRYFTGRSGQGDDVSLSSLKEFEGLESACIQAHKTEVKAKEEEELLAQIDEGQENTVSESGSCEMVLTTDKKLTLESDEDDYEKRMFEIDEIIRQAQSNVERFIDLAEHADKTPSLGRGDSLEEVAKVPDLDLDTTCSKISTVSTNLDDLMLTSTDSLDSKRPMFHASTDSLEMKTTAADLMTTSMDSIELQSQQRAHSRDIMTDSIEMQQDRSLVASDSLDLATGTNTNFGALSDSIDEDGSRIGEILCQDRSSSSGRDGDLSSASKEDVAGGLNAQLMLGSTDSLEPTSSTATHATYQYETDSALSSSFTSGGSNTMVSSTDTIDPQASGLPPVDLAAAIRQVWSDDNSSSGEGATAGSSRHDFSRPYVTEVIEPCEDDPEFSHTIHRTVELPAEVQKVTFRGPDAEAQMLRYISDFKEGEDVQETEELDADGNVHVTRVIQKRIIVKSDDDKLDSTLSGSELETYLQSMTTSAEEVYGTPKYEVIPTNVAGERGTATHSETITHRTYVTRHVTPVHVDTKGEGWDQAQSSTVAQEDAAVSSARRVEIEEGVGSSTAFQTSQDQRDFPVNQQSLSEEMKELLKELEEQSHK